MKSSHTSRQAAPRTPDHHRFPRAWLFYASLVILIIASYANSLSNGFAYDDRKVILDNELIRDISNVPLLLISDYWAVAPDEAGPAKSDVRSDVSSGLYRPLVIASYALNYSLSGLTPWTYHLVNVLLHLAVTLFLYRLTTHMGIGASSAFVGAAIFAVHPIHTEAVTSVVGRAELMMAFGVLLSLWAAHQERWSLSLTVYLIALLSKEQAIIMPALLVLQDVCALPSGVNRAALDQWLRGRLRWYLIVVVVSAVFFTWRLWVLGGWVKPPTTFLVNPLAEQPWPARVSGALKVAGLYLLLFFWPSGLSADYSYNSIPLPFGWSDPGVLLGVAMWGVAVFWAIVAFTKRDRRVAFGVGLMVLTYLPVANILVPIGTIMGERLFYLPSVGLCVALASGLDLLLARLHRMRSGRIPPVDVHRDQLAGSSPVVRTGMIAAVALVLLALSARTILRNQDWSDTETLMRKAIVVVPLNAKVHAIIGRLLGEQGKEAEAIPWYEQAFRLYPDYPEDDPLSAMDMAVYLMRLNRTSDSVVLLERVASKMSESSVLFFNLAQAYIQSQQWEKGEKALRRACELAPTAVPPRISLLALLLRFGRNDEALTLSEEVLRLAPDEPGGAMVQAFALEQLGRSAEAIAVYQHILRRHPTVREARERLARLMADHDDSAPGRRSESGNHSAGGNSFGTAP